MMPDRNSYDAVVVGAGPNGLAAAVTLSDVFESVLLVEGKETIGGGCRSAELTLPQFIHDVCSAAHPLALASPFFRRLGLERFDLDWVQPEIPLAHPFEDGSALCLHRSLDMTADALGPDGKRYKSLLAPFVERSEQLISDILAPPHFPEHPWLMARFALKALASARKLTQGEFKMEATRALFAGLAAHAMVPLEKTATAAFGIVLAVLAHTVGWPFIRGGSQKLADALADVFRQRRGDIVTGRSILSMEQLPKARFYFFDLTPRQLLNIKLLDLSAPYRKRLTRFRYGPGVFKMDWALKEPIPWTADVCRKAGTVHLGHSFGEISAAVRLAHEDKVCSSPFIVLAQQSLFDPSRAPDGSHTAWAYCHVPHGSAESVADIMERKIERYAPGFREIILAKSSMPAPAMERYNPNYIGGDINGGLQDLRQLYARPVLSLFPYRTSNRAVFICSSSTPPGGGVHGLCGYFAVKAACKR